MNPIAWAVQYPDGSIDYELVGTQRAVEWWCSTDEGRAAGRRPVRLFIDPIEQPVVTFEVTILAEYTLGTGRRQHVHVAADLYPGDVVATLKDWRTNKREVAQLEEQRPHKPPDAGSSPAFATNHGNET